MNAKDKIDFTTMIILTAELYGRPKPSEALIMMYWSALSRFEFKSVKNGLNKHVQNPDNGQFFPKPADIIRQIDGDTNTQGHQAWTKVDKGIRLAGSWQSVVFDDFIIHAVIADMGGWVKLCEMTCDEYPFKQNEFIKRYQGFISNKPTEYPSVLIGRSEAANDLQGFDSEAPLVIGHFDKAALVLSSGYEKQGVVNSLADVRKLERPNEKHE